MSAATFTQDSVLTTNSSEQSSAGNLSPQLQALIETEVSQRVEQRLSAIEARLAAIEPRTVSNKATIVLFSGEMDKVLAALVLAVGAATMGLETTVFSTFWGLMPFRKARKLDGKDWIEKALNLMTPAGTVELQPSRMSYAGLGAKLFRKRMQDKGIQSLEEMLEMAKELGVRFIACEMSMDVLGISADELIDGIQIGGVASYYGEAADSKVTLFI